MRERTPERTPVTGGTQHNAPTRAQIGEDGVSVSAVTHLARRGVVVQQQRLRRTQKEFCLGRVQAADDHSPTVDNGTASPALDLGGLPQQAPGGSVPSKGRAGPPLHSITGVRNSRLENQTTGLWRDGIGPKTSLGRTFAWDKHNHPTPTPLLGISWSRPRTFRLHQALWSALTRD